MRPGRRVWGFGMLAFALVLTLAFAPAASAKLIIGSKRDNKLVGTGKRDDIFGRDGRDVLIGFKGWDRLYGEEDNDVLVGAGRERPPLGEWARRHSGRRPRLRRAAARVRD